MVPHLEKKHIKRKLFNALGYNFQRFVLMSLMAIRLWEHLLTCTDMPYLDA